MVKFISTGVLATRDRLYAVFRIRIRSIRKFLCIADPSSSKNSKKKNDDFYCFSDFIKSFIFEM